MMMIAIGVGTTWFARMLCRLRYRGEFRMRMWGNGLEELDNGSFADAEESGALKGYIVGGGSRSV